MPALFTEKDRREFVDAGSVLRVLSRVVARTDSRGKYIAGRMTDKGVETRMFDTEDEFDAYKEAHPDAVAMVHYNPNEMRVGC